LERKKNRERPNTSPAISFGLFISIASQTSLPPSFDESITPLVAVHTESTMTTSPPPHPPPNQLRILVVRHGETHENAAGIVQGQLDTDLNASGRLQAATTARHLSTVRFDRIITSPLRRARDTAQAILEQQQSTSPQLRLEQDSRLKERGLGVLEGKKWAAPANRSEEDTSSFEHKHHLLERVASFWNELVTFPAVSPPQLQQEKHSSSEQTPATQHDSNHDNEKTILLVSHGATISALMDELLLAGQYLHAPPDIRHWRENCCITEIVVPIILDHRSPPPATSKQPAGDNITLKETWTIRPLHLGVQGAQRLLEIKSLESNLAHLRRRRHAASADDTALETQIQTLQASLNLSHADLENNGIRKSLEEDVLLGPDGQEVTQDLGYGKGVGYIVKWADTTHLQGLMNDDGMEGEVLEHSHHAPVNVDELVEKSDPTV
jgi:broad specificity phosphatase PhoE